MLSKMGLPPNFTGWTSRPEFKGTGLPSGPGSVKAHAMLDLGWALRKTSMPSGSFEECTSDYFVDISQMPCRSCFGSLGTITTSSCKYSYELDSCLSPADQLAMMGLPWKAVRVARDTMSSAELKSLSGEGFSCPCIASMCYAYWANPYGPWWRQYHDQDQES